MDRWWLLTWTTYGTWLPGDRRGFVSSVPDGSGPQRKHNQVGRVYDRDHPVIQSSAAKLMKEDVIRLDARQAEMLKTQFQETATHRGWRLVALAVMWNHVHLVVGVPGNPDPAALLRDFKSYGSRVSNRSTPEFHRERWWTESGSRRKLPDETALAAAVRYAATQHQPLVVWVEAEFTSNSLDDDHETSAGERGASAP